MTEEIRHEIVRRHQGGASIRRIAADLHLARQTVQAVIRRSSRFNSARPG
jgi:IS30 family transposase